MQPSISGRWIMFLSARPVQAATPCCAASARSWNSFYPRGPCRPRRQAQGSAQHLCHRFYPRGPCRPRQAFRPWSLRDRCFYPRGPCRPRPGCGGPEPVPGCFYPRGPCGPRLSSSVRSFQAVLFLSARPVRAATGSAGYGSLQAGVSIRATRAGRDQPTQCCLSPCRCFYPRDPCGPRPRRLVELRVELFVSIRATRAGRDARRSISRQAITEFLSARPVRAATSSAATSGAK